MRLQRFRRGLTLIEIAISLALIALIILPIYFTMAKSRETVAQSSEYRMARVAVQTVIERMRVQASAPASAQYNFRNLCDTTATVPNSPFDWLDTSNTQTINASVGSGAGQTGITPNSQFFIAGLPPRGDAGNVGAPHLQVTINTAAGALVEDLVYSPSNSGGINTAASVAVSLDKDDDASGVAINGLYRAVPVTITVFWGQSAQPRLTVTTLIAKPTDYMRENES